MTPQSARGLGVLDSALIVVGCIVGAGIFLVSPFVAKEVHSPFAFLATWVLGGGIAFAGATCNGELGGLFPRSGGEYVYLREAYGPAMGFLSGWTSFWIAFPGSIAALAAGFGATAAPLVGWRSPNAPLVVAVVVVVIVTCANTLGIRPGKWIQNVLSTSKLVAFAILLLLGLLFGHDTPSGLTPFFASGGNTDGIANGLIPVLFAYSGWNAATYVAGEMRAPHRDLGRALALGTAICVALYLAINVVYLRALPLAAMAQSTDAARDSVLRLGGFGAGWILSPLVALCVLSSLQATVLVGPRIYQAMAADGLFFEAFGRTERRTGAPVVALLVQGAVSVVLLLAGSIDPRFDRLFDRLLTFTMFSIVSFSTLAVAAVIVLRIRRPDSSRPFRVAGYPAVPALFVAVNAWLLWNVLQHGSLEALKGVAIVATGVPAYFAFRRSQSRKDQKVTA